MAPYRLDVLELGEIKECTVSCPNCQTKISLRLDRMAPIARACPSCNKKFDQDLDGALSGLAGSLRIRAADTFQDRVLHPGVKREIEPEEGKVGALQARCICSSSTSLRSLVTPYR